MGGATSAAVAPRSTHFREMYVAVNIEQRHCNGVYGNLENVDTVLFDRHDAWEVHLPLPSSARVAGMCCRMRTLVFVANFLLDHRGRFTPFSCTFDCFGRGVCRSSFVTATKRGQRRQVEPVAELPTVATEVPELPVFFWNMIHHVGVVCPGSVFFRCTGRRSVDAPSAVLGTPLPICSPRDSAVDGCATTTTTTATTTTGGERFLDRCPGTFRGRPQRRHICFGV